MPPRRSTVEKARKLRRNLSPPEVKLWNYLRTRPLGLKFRRQHPLGSYILDFYCAEARLCVEIDGISHDMGQRPAADRCRDQWLTAQGLRIVRIPAAEVMKDMESVVRAIFDACAREFPLHHPSDGPPPHAEHGAD
jgi:very-short-patch-repair endonuclease